MTVGIGAALFSQTAKCAAYPANTTYYISNTGCSNGNDGKTPLSPWCDFANVNGSTFSPGDAILLQSGGQWTGTLRPLGNGSIASPISIGCYDSPSSSCQVNFPSITSSSTETSVSLQNPSHWRVAYLTLTGGQSGIWVRFTSLGNSDLAFSHLYLHDQPGIEPSIGFDGLNSNPPQAIPAGQSIISDVTISNVYMIRAGGIGFTAGYANAQQVNNGYSNAQSNILMSNVSAVDYHSCFALANASHVKMISSYFENADKDGHCGAGFYVTTVDDFTITNSIFYRQPFSNVNDNAVFVYDNQETALKWYGDYFFQNGGSGIEGAENPSFSYSTVSTNSAFEIKSSTFFQNSTANVCSVPSNPSATYGYYGDISVAYSPQTTMVVTGNLYSDSAQTCNGFVVRQNAAFQSLFNNLNFGSELFNSGSQFSGTQGQNQWLNERWDGSTWANSSMYDDNLRAWTFPSGGSIGQFDIKPDSCAKCWTARIWQAPRAGNVHVVGWVAKNTTGTTAQVGINKSGVWIWGDGNGSWRTLGANDRDGVSTNVNTTVAAGEWLVFVVGDQTSGDPSAAVVSWMPSITYQ